MPHVTCGANVAASNVTLRSNFAPSSLRHSSHRAASSSNSLPLGRYRRPRRYSTVVLSAATIPARAPPSIDMLQTVIRSSIDSASTAAPRYSITCPVAPLVLILPMMPRIKSFAPTPVPSFPSTRISNVCGRSSHRHCVASTCSTSLVPMPNASAPNAPCVAVWLSPQTIVMPGCVRPSSGPMTCTIPCSREPISNSLRPNSAQLLRSVSICSFESGSVIGLLRSVVGTL